MTAYSTLLFHNLNPSCLCITELRELPVGKSSLVAQISHCLKEHQKSRTGSKQEGNGNANLQSQDDLEMVQNATKSNNTVLEDGSRDADSVQTKTMATVATAIENIARILFPLAFISYNIFYWTYY